LANGALERWEKVDQHLLRHGLVSPHFAQSACPTNSLRHRTRVRARGLLADASGGLTDQSSRQL